MLSIHPGATAEALGAGGKLLVQEERGDAVANRIENGNKALIARCILLKKTGAPPNLSK
jgi:hypothetical protein